MRVLMQRITMSGEIREVTWRQACRVWLRHAGLQWSVIAMRLQLP